MSDALFPFYDALVLRVCGALVPRWRVVPVLAPDNLFATVCTHYARTGEVLVSTEYSDQTIFGSPHVNHAFRACHDWTHIQLQAPFDREGEFSVWQVQCHAATRFADNAHHGRLAVDILYCEIIGQFDYQTRTGLFPSNQRAFARAWLQANTVAK